MPSPARSERRHHRRLQLSLRALVLLVLIVGAWSVGWKTRELGSKPSMPCSGSRGRSSFEGQRQNNTTAPTPTFWAPAGRDAGSASATTIFRVYRAQPLAMRGR